MHTMCWHWILNRQQLAQSSQTPCSVFASQLPCLMLLPARTATISCRHYCASVSWRRVTSSYYCCCCCCCCLTVALLLPCVIAAAATAAAAGSAAPAAPGQGQQTLHKSKNKRNAVPYPSWQQQDSAGAGGAMPGSMMGGGAAPGELRRYTCTVQNTCSAVGCRACTQATYCTHQSTKEPAAACISTVKRSTNTHCMRSLHICLPIPTASLLCPGLQLRLLLPLAVISLCR
jgi:hypothetical protein